MVHCGLDEESDMKVNSWNAFLGGGLVVVGFLYLLDNFGYLEFSFWDMCGKMWPLILIFLGVSIIVSRPKGGGRGCFEGSNSYSGFVGDIRMDISVKQIDNLRTSNFIGNIDLTVGDTGLADGDNKLTVSSFIGDATITLPKGLPFMISQSNFIGDSKIDGVSLLDAGHGKQKTENYDESSGRLIIQYSALIGDLKVFVK